MDIKLELLKAHICDYIDAHIDDFSIDADSILTTDALEILARVKEILCNESYTDFDAIEEIVRVFESNGIYCGSRHDF